MQILTILCEDIRLFLELMMALDPETERSVSNSGEEIHNTPSQSD